MTGESWLTDEEFARIRALVAAESGIQVREERRAFLARRVAGRLLASGARVDAGSVAAYRRRLEQGADPDELLALLDSLTVNETAFFRHTAQWELFARRILPELLEAAQQAGRHRLALWSAGCSTGAEPYTIAMVVAEALVKAGAPLSSWEIRILASDLSLTALATAEAAVYPPERLGGVTPERLARHFVRDGDGYRVRDELRRWVEVDFHNLLHPVTPPAGGFDAVFCRNVLIYFNPEGRRKVIHRLLGHLNARGLLLVGHAENLAGVTRRAVSVAPTIYSLEAVDEKVAR